MRYRLDPDLLRIILPLLAREGRTLQHATPSSIALRKVLVGKPYSNERLLRCRNRLVANRAHLSPISVVRYWLYNQDYFITSNDSYLLTDSYHIAIAARDCEYARIKARIHAEHWCQPNMYRLDPAKAMLWRQTEDGWKFIKNELTVEQIQVLRLIGVGAMVYGPKGLRRDVLPVPQVC